MTFNLQFILAFLHSVIFKDGIPVLRHDQRVTDVRNGQVLLQVLVLLTGLIMAPH